MRGINHLVLAGQDLDAMRSAYAGLGFTVAPRGQHPFGTGNSVIQLHGSYLELLAVTEPQDVVEHASKSFSFSAFNRDYLKRHDGFSMLAFDTPDAGADLAAWQNAGLQTYEPFQFSRLAKLPDGEDVTVGFSLAFVSDPRAPWIGLFACQHFRPDYYAQARYLDHSNTAQAVADVWITGPGAVELADTMARVTRLNPTVSTADRIVFKTRYGDVILAEPSIFEDAFGEKPPHPEDGPHLAGVTVGCRTLESLGGLGLKQIGEEYVLPASRNFGTALRFAAF
jgi:hypothetical protein